MEDVENKIYSINFKMKKKCYENVLTINKTREKDDELFKTFKDLKRVYGGEDVLV